MKINDLLLQTLNQNVGRGIETDLNEIACEGVNRPQIEGLIAVWSEGNQRLPFREPLFF
jgi:hypothetical protein